MCWTIDGSSGEEGSAPATSTTVWYFVCVCVSPLCVLCCASRQTPSPGKTVLLFQLFVLLSCSAVIGRWKGRYARTFFARLPRWSRGNIESLRERPLIQLRTIGSRAVYAFLMDATFCSWYLSKPSAVSQRTHAERRRQEESCTNTFRTKQQQETYSYFNFCNFHARCYVGQLFSHYNVHILATTLETNLSFSF